MRIMRRSILGVPSKGHYQHDPLEYTETQNRRSKLTNIHHNNKASSVISTTFKSSLSAIYNTSPLPSPLLITTLPQHIQRASSTNFTTINSSIPSSLTNKKNPFQKLALKNIRGYPALSNRTKPAHTPKPLLSPSFLPNDM
jgi:hypothetical protein